MTPSEVLTARDQSQEQNNADSRVAAAALHKEAYGNPASDRAQGNAERADAKPQLIEAQDRQAPAEQQQEQELPRSIQMLQTAMERFQASKSKDEAVAVLPEFKAATDQADTEFSNAERVIENLTPQEKQQMTEFSTAAQNMQKAFAEVPNHQKQEAAGMMAGLDEEVTPEEYARRVDALAQRFPGLGTAVREFDRVSEANKATIEKVGTAAMELQTGLQARIMTRTMHVRALQAVGDTAGAQAVMGELREIQQKYLPQMQEERNAPRPNQDGSWTIRKA